MREREVVSLSHTHTQSDYASLTEAVDLMRVVIFAVLCYTTPQSSTHQHKPLWRLSGGGREGEREGRHLCSQSSFEDGCYSDQPQICQLMKGRHSAVDGTHTRRAAFSTCRRRSTASEDAKLTNKLPPLTHLWTGANGTSFSTAALWHQPIRKHLWTKKQIKVKPGRHFY